jgi:hypothetical protein
MFVIFSDDSFSILIRWPVIFKQSVSTSQAVGYVQQLTCNLEPKLQVVCILVSINVLYYVIIYLKLYCKFVIIYV